MSRIIRKNVEASDQKNPGGSTLPSKKVAFSKKELPHTVENGCIIVDETVTEEHLIALIHDG